MFILPSCVQATAYKLHSTYVNYLIFMLFQGPRLNSVAQLPTVVGIARWMIRVFMSLQIRVRFLIFSYVIILICSFRSPYQSQTGGSRATCTDGLPPASTDRPGLAFDLSGLVSLRARSFDSFPLAFLTSSFPTTPTLQTSIVPMQATSQPLSLTTIFKSPFSACPIMQLTLSSRRPTTASRSPSTKATAPCLPPTHTSPGSTLLCPATATLFPSAGPQSFLVSPLIPTSPSPPTSGEWPNVPAPALASSRPWQGWARDSPRRSSCSPTRC